MGDPRTLLESKEWRSHLTLMHLLMYALRTTSLGVGSLDPPYATELTIP